jgi:hypothetical protein
MTVLAEGGAAALGFVIPLTKIDAERRLVYGIGAHEVPDKTNEILDYASSKPNFLAWSKSFDEATGGMSKGNVRVMHTKTVAGKLLEMTPDDDAKMFKVCAHIVDDNEWAKVLGGVYTGFSVGGKYDRKWEDGGMTRYTARPSEISLVDSPCIPTARFAELVKADGIVEQLPLTGRRDSFAAAWAARPVGFADLWDARPASFGEAWGLEKAAPKGVRKPEEPSMPAGRVLGTAYGIQAGIHRGRVLGASAAYDHAMSGGSMHDAVKIGAKRIGGSAILGGLAGYGVGAMVDHYRRRSVMREMGFAKADFDDFEKGLPWGSPGDYQRSFGTPLRGPAPRQPQPRGFLKPLTPEEMGYHHNANLGSRKATAFRATPDAYRNAAPPRPPAGGGGGGGGGAVVPYRGIGGGRPGGFRLGRAGKLGLLAAGAVGAGMLASHFMGGKKKRVNKVESSEFGKAWSASQHTRHHDGKFASKTGAQVGRTAGGLIGIGIGAHVGGNVGYRAGLERGAAQWSERAAGNPNAFHGASSPENAIRHISNAGKIGRSNGRLVGGLLGGLVGTFGGNALGHQIDMWRHRRTARAAGREEQFDRLNSGASALPSKKTTQATFKRIGKT